MHNNDYDLVSIVGVESLNRAVVAGWNDCRREINYQGDGVRIEGQCAPWTLVPGSFSGIYVRVKLPFTGGEMQADGREPVSLQGVVFTLELTLDFIRTESRSDVRELRFCARRILRSSDEQRYDDPAQIGCFAPVKLEVPAGREMIKPDKYLLMNTICEALTEDPGLIRFAFASLSDRNTFIPVRASRYCYIQGGYLAIMSVCDDRDVSRMPATVIVPGGLKGALLSISGDVFFRYFSEMFVHVFREPVSPRDWRCRVYGMELCCGRRMIDMVKVGALYYRPMCLHMNLQVNGDRCISVALHGECDLYYNINMTFEYSFDLLLHNNDGSVFFEVRRTTKRDWYHVKVPVYLSIMLGIPDLVANVIADLLDKQFGRLLLERLRFANFRHVAWAGCGDRIADAYFDTNFTIEYKER